MPEVTVFPGFSLLGVGVPAVQVFVPDLNDLENFILSPLNDAVGGLASIVNGMASTATGIGASMVNLLTTFAAWISKTVVTQLGTYITQALSGIGGAVNSILGPLESFIATVRDYIVNALTTAFNALLALPGQVYTFFTSTFPSALGSLGGMIMSGLSQAWAVLSSIPATIFNAFAQLGANIRGLFTSIVPQILAYLNTYVYQPLSSALTSVSAYVQDGLRSLGSQLDALGVNLQSGLGSLGSNLSTGINAVSGSLGAALGDVNHTLGNLGEVVSSAYNQLATGINGLLSSIWSGLADAVGAIWSAIQTYIITPLEQALTAIGNAIMGVIADIFSAVKNGLLAILPKSPDAAFDEAMLAVFLGASATIVGQVIGVVADFPHPFKKLGVQDAIAKTLDVLGVATISTAMFGIIVESGFGVQLRYFFNYNLTPNRIDLQTSLTAVYYGVRTLDQFQTDMQYEGFNADAVAAKVATLYQPINFRLLVTLWEENLVSDEFIQGELRKQGYDPARTGDILKALQFRALKPFEDSAKSLVFLMYKDGYLDQGTATNILDSFGTPKTQEAFIFQMGRYQFTYEQKVLMQTYILNLVKKAQLNEADAIAALSELGLDADRATVLVKIALTTVLPTVTKAQRAAVLEALLGVAPAA